jgi:predicted transcriptional regulator
LPTPEAETVTTDDSLTRAEELLARVEAVRGELERLSAGEGGSPDRAIELLGELSELAKAVEEELTRAQRAAEAADAQS